MAIKASNKITIIEQKKIKEIKEWYLATNQDTGVTRDTNGWTTEVQIITENNKYLWNYEEVIYTLGSSDVSDPVIIGTYSGTGASLQVKYISSATVPVITNNDVSTWSDEVPAPQDGERVYMTQKMSTDTNWSTPIQISATDGKNGEANVEINSDGYWVINGETTEIKAHGEDGKSPEVTIGENGNWYIDGVDSGTKAQGEAGKDGSDIEYVYYRSESEIDLSAPSYTDDILTSGWTKSPQGITETYKYEYVSIRQKPSDGVWGDFSDPVIWSKWGEKGQDGDGVEYKYYLSNSSTIPTYSSGDTKWTDDPTGVSKDNQYEYVVQIKTSNGTSTTSTPSLWAKYGVDGLSISAVNNYYQATLDTNPPSSWDTEVPLLSPENRYLWNYEEIVYTDGSKTTTDPAIIGVYVDAGTSTVDFQIYSVDGFEFSEDVSSIELKTAAFYGGNAIESGATYQWKYWNADSTLEDKYEDITDATSSSLTIVPTDSYAFVGLKCEMKYDGIVYSDFVTLTKKDVVYTSTIKFMGGSNIFNSSSPYLLAYVELYKGQKLEDTIRAEKFYNGDNIVESGVITSDFDNEDDKLDLMYFLATCDHTTTGGDHYIAVLGQFDSWIYDTEDTSLVVGSIWNVIDNSSNKYSYINNLYTDVTTNVIVVSKEDVSKTKEINIEVYEMHDINEDDMNKVQRTLLSTTNATVVDLNDPIISDTEPANVKYGQLWLDTSVNPYVLKIYTKIENTNYKTDKEKPVILMTGKNAATFLYGNEEDIIVFDDGALSLPSTSSTVSISYSTYQNADKLKGKFYQKSDSEELYYMSEESSNYTSTSEVNIPGYGMSTIYYVYSSKASKVSVDINKSGEWQYFSQQNGGTVYTSIPLNGYAEGDIWIISDDDVSSHSETYTELFDKFGSGTMLKSNVDSSSFDQSHWYDAQSETTSIINNVKQYFEFNADDGLKIGRKDESFYVNISAERMSFFDNTGDSPKEVVYISNSTANIDNVVIEGSAKFDCNTTFNGSVNINGNTSENESVGFMWKIESNGSLSLAISS